MCSLPLCPLLLDCRFSKLVLRGLCGSIHSSYGTICGKEKKQSWRQRLKILQNKCSPLIFSKFHTQALSRIWHSSHQTMSMLHHWLDCNSTCFRLVSGVIGTASCWLVICASCCHLLAVPLSVWLASCSVLHKNHRDACILKRPGMFISSAVCMSAGLQKNYKPRFN